MAPVDGCHVSHHSLDRMTRMQVMEMQEKCPWHGAPQKVSLNVEEGLNLLEVLGSQDWTLLQTAAALHMISMEKTGTLALGMSRTENAGPKAVSLVQSLRRQLKCKEVLGTHIQKLPGFQLGSVLTGLRSVLHTIVFDMPSMGRCAHSPLQKKNALILGSHQSS